MESNLSNVNLGLPIRTLMALVELAERAPLHEAERLWIEDLKANVVKTLNEQQAQPKTEA